MVTGRLTAWNPTANAAVYALLIKGPNMYIGGSFTQVNEQPRSCMAATDLVSGALISWDPQVSGCWVLSPSTMGPGQPIIIVHTLATTGATIYAGGSFSHIGGQARSNIAALDLVTGAPIVWAPQVNNAVSTMVLSGTTAYVGGYFTSVGGQERHYLAAMDIRSGVLTSWNPGVSGSDQWAHVGALAVQRDTVYVGGRFTSVAGQPRVNLAELGITTGNPTPWAPNPNTVVNELLCSKTAVYIGGVFTTIGERFRSGIAGYNLVTDRVFLPFIAYGQGA